MLNISGARVSLLFAVVLAAACVGAETAKSDWSITMGSTPATCEATFDQWYETATAPAAEVASFASGGDFQDDLTICSRVGEMGYDDDFNCRDFAYWFVRCMQNRGNSNVWGLSMSCNGCTDGDDHGHRAVLYQRPDGSWCPAEPQGSGEASGCCNASRIAASACANERWCNGTWPDRPMPIAGRDGCRPSDDDRRLLSCSACEDACTDEQREQVCTLVQIAE